MVEVARVVREVGLVDVQVAVAIVVGNTYTHARLLLAVLVVRAPSHDRDVRKGAVVVVAEQYAGLGIDGDINVGPPVVVKIIGHSSDRVARPRLENARFLGNVREGAVPVVVVKHVRAAGQPARATHYGQPLPLAVARLAGSGYFLEVDLNVMAHKQIEVAVAIVVNPRAARAPAYAILVQAGFLSHIRERAVAIVVKQHAVAPVADEEVVPAVVVVVPHAHAGQPAAHPQAGLGGYVGKRAIAVILVKVGRWGSARSVGLF